MNARKYVVKTSVEGVTWTKIWSGKRSVALGQQLPWEIHDREGKLRLRHRNGQAWDINPEMVENRSAIQLPDPEKKMRGAVSLTIRRIEGIEAPYETSRANKDLPKGNWRVYRCSGDSVLGTQLLKSGFVARYKGQKLFQVDYHSNEFSLKILDSAVRIEGLKSAEVSGQGSDQVIFLKPEELASLVISRKSHVWRFNRVEDSEAMAAVSQRLVVDEDQARFKRSFMISLTAFVALFAVSFLLQKTTEEQEKTTSQFAKIVFQKKPKVSQPQSPLSQPEPAVEAEPAEKVASKSSGTSVQAAKASLAQPPKPLKVAEAPSAVSKKKRVSSQKSSRVVRKVSKKAQRVQKVANLKRSLKSSLGKFGKGKQKGKQLGSLLEAGNIKKSRRQNSGAGVLSSASRLKKGSGAQVLAESGPQNVSVGYTGGSGSASGVGSAAAYRDSGSADSGGRGARSNQRAFLKVASGPKASGTYVESGLTKSEVFEVINRHMSEVRYCYETAILRRPDVEGKLMVNFVIGSRGKVTNSEVKVSTLADSKLDQCVLSRLVKWKFPKPKGGADVAVTYPFIFRRL